MSNNLNERKPIVAILVVLACLLASCNMTDEVVSYGDDILRLYGDDILKYSGRIVEGSAEDYVRALSAYGDDVAHLSGQLMDDASRKAASEYNRAFQVKVLDLSANAPALTDPGTNSLVFKSNPNLTPIQDEVLQYLNRILSTEDEAALFLESACEIIAFVALVGKTPPQDYSNYLVKQHAEAHGIKLISLLEFSGSATKFAKDLITGQEAGTLKYGAKLVLDGLCLIP